MASNSLKYGIELYKQANKKRSELLSRKSSVDDVLKDIEENHNHSWYQEVYTRNNDSLDDIALLYKGEEISYGEMFAKMKEYAKSLRQMGLGKGSEIPVCISNCPEIVYLIGSASMIGAKLNIFGKFYPNDYICRIINETESKIIFVEDNNYDEIKEGIDESNVETIIMLSLADSLKNGNAFIDLELNPEIYISKVEKYKSQDESILSQKEFLAIGEDYDGELDIPTDLNTEFLITYTSGSTNEKRPKAIIHNTRSFNTIGRFHDKELNGGKSIKPLTLLAIIPTYSNSNLISCISDALMQGAKLAFEPYYNPDQFLNTLIMYNPHYVGVTKSFWLHISKKLLCDDKYKDVKLKNLFLAFSCGEPFEINEENLINKALKKAKMGTNVMRFPFPIVRMSEAAGDCEHGSIFFILFRSYKNLKPKNKKRGEAEGLAPFKFCDVAVLDEQGNYLHPYELGRLVANSPCTMKGYKNNPEATDSFFMKDATGKVWGDMNVYGYMDKSGKVYIRGRIPKEGELIPPFILAKQVLKDRKNILSCEVVRDDESGVYIAHLEFNPEVSKNPANILQEAHKRCESILAEHQIKLCFRIRTFEESFPLTGSGKRDVRALKKEGLSEKCVIPVEKNGKCLLETYI